MPQVNQRVGEYVLEAPLGRGAFGEVWRARHHVWADQRAAVKIPTNPQYLRDLQHEGVAIHGLLHPNIVRAIAFDPYATPPYLVTEYVPGVSLRKLIIERGRLRSVDAVAVLRQMLGGLAHAHASGIVHRDIKPENVLIHERFQAEGLEAEGVVKLTDFGLGRTMRSDLEQSIAFSASLNTPEARQIAGTLDYMAPEQRGGESDARADLYACGVVLYEMLTGEKPAGTDVPSELNPSVPRRLDEVFRRSYARLDKRFASAEEFLGALGTTTPPPLPAVDTVKTCPHCRQVVAAGDQYCMHCGLQLTPQVRRCRKCGAYPDVDDRYCLFCGEALAPGVSLVT